MGTLELLCGPMFSGKTDELIRRVRAARAEGRRAVVVKPAIDDRHPRDVVVSHAGQSVDAIAIEVERISEGQRFTTKLLAERNTAAASGLTKPES